MKELREWKNSGSWCCAANRSEEALKEAGRKAARTRAERYGEELKVSAPENDDLQVGFSQFILPTS